MEDNDDEIEVTFKYTSVMAVEDDILRFSSDYVKDYGKIRYITTNLYNRLKETKTNISKIYKLAIDKMKMVDGFNKKPDTFYAVDVVLKDGKNERLFIGKNDRYTTEKPAYTIMLDTDY